jgi:hypothetical protein
VVSKDITKRNESVMKVLNTGGEDAATLSDITFFAIGTVLLVVAFTASAVVLYITLVAEVETLRSQAPHLNSLAVLYSHELAALYALHVLRMNRTSPHIHISSEMEMIDKIQRYLASARAAYYLASYGGDELWQHPFSEWHDRVAEVRAALNSSRT